MKTWARIFNCKYFVEEEIGGIHKKVGVFECGLRNSECGCRSQLRAESLKEDRSLNKGII